MIASEIKFQINRSNNTGNGALMTAIGDSGGVEKVPAIVYNITIIVNRFQGWIYNYVRYSKTLAGRLVCCRSNVPYCFKVSLK